MKGRWLYYLIVASFLLNSCSKDGEFESTIEIPTIIPAPTKILKRSGTITLNNSFWVIANVSDSTTASATKYLVDQLNQVTGNEAFITDLYSTRKHKQSISLAISDLPMEQGSAGYVIDATSSQIKLKAQSERGLYCGIQTLKILLEGSRKDKNTYVLRKCVIKDKPVFTRRGIMIESPMTIEEIKEFAYLSTSKKISELYINSMLYQELADNNFGYPIKIYNQDDFHPDDSTLVIDIDAQDLSSELVQNTNLQRVIFFTANSNEEVALKLNTLSEYGWNGHTTNR